jgi:hypothetical protein
VIIAFAYLIYIFAPKAKIWYLLGSSKKVRKILIHKVGLQKNHTRHIAETINSVESLFSRAGQTDYPKLFDTLQKIRVGSEPQLCQVIDLLAEKIKEEHPFCLLASDKASAFESAKRHIADSKNTEVMSALDLLYQQCISMEDALRRKSKKEFWIAAIIGILGIAVAFIQF